MRLRTLIRRTRGAYILVALLVLGGAVVYFTNSAPPAQAEVNHDGQVVPDLARRNLPVTIGGRVQAHAQVGNRIFVGGDFTQVRLQDGTVVNQPFLFAYDINSGAFDTNFRPVLNNQVESLETNADNNGLYVGGRFTRWEAGGATNFPLRIAKLDAFGNLDTGFNASASAVVLSIEQVGNDLYIGGDFTNVSNQPIRGLARVDANTGAVDTGFNLQLNNSVAGSQIVRRVEAHPNGNELFVLHYNQQVLGQLRRAVFKLDISSPTPVLSNWEIPWQQQTNDRLCWVDLRDMAISPDGSFIVIGGQGADNPPNCDSVLRYETAGNSVQPFTWSARMYSSVFSLAVTDAAVYVGGHFCAAPRQGAIYQGGRYTSNFVNTANGCSTNPNDPINPSQRDPNNAVFRNQIAALNPTTAQALPWDPGSNNDVGVFDLTVTDRGLLAGHDGDRFSQFLVGGSGFFDFGGNTPGVEPPAGPACTVALNGAGQPVVSYSGFNGVSTVVVRVDGGYLANSAPGSGSFIHAAATPGSHSYLLRWRPGGVVNDVQCTPNPINVGANDTTIPSAEVTSPANGTTISTGTTNIQGIATDDLSGISEVRVRIQQLGTSNFWDGNAFAPGSIFHVATLNGNGTWTYPNVTFPTGTFRIRLIAIDNANNIAAAIDNPLADITVVGGAPPPPPPPPPGDGPACTVALNGAGDPVLTYSGFDGPATVFVRVDGGFLAGTPGGSGTFTDTTASDGPHSYLIRWRPNGVVNDITCNPSPITVGGAAPPPPPPPPPPPAGNGCTASVAGNGAVNLTWTAIPGEDLYQVRDNGGWVATVGNALSFTDNNPDSGSRTYVIRNRGAAGVVNDVTCNTVTVP